MVEAGRIVLSLLAVLASLAGMAWLARRSKGAGRSGLRIVSRVPVSKGSSLLVVSVGSRMLLVGATEGSLRLLSELDPADLEGAQTEAAPLTSAQTSSVLIPGPSGITAAQLLAGDLPVSSVPSGPAGSFEPAAAPALAAALSAAASEPASRSVAGPWTGLVRHLQRMTLRTAPEGPFRARKR